MHGTLKNCNTLADVEEQVKLKAANKTEVKVDKVLREKVGKLVAKEEMPLQLAYHNIHEYATELALTHKEYYVQPLQTFMAAWCATTKHQHAIILAAPAEGKTFAFLHFLRYKISQDKEKNTEAVIYCPQEVVANQAREKLSMFDCAELVTVTAEWEPNAWLSNPRNKIFVVDEGEEAIETRLLDLTPKGLNGLAALRDRQTFLYTATLTEYWKLCWRNVFAAPEEAVHRFPSSLWVKTGREYSQDVRVSVRETKPQTRKAFIERLVE